jgi:hypothetical protein
MKPSQFQMSNIYQAWCRGLPPLEVASELRLVPITVIAEYVRLDDLSQLNQE